jgi:hypothetical protein
MTVETKKFLISRIGVILICGPLLFIPGPSQLVGFGSILAITELLFVMLDSKKKREAKRSKGEA